MKICRFNENRLGVVRGETIVDVTHLLDALPAIRWPAPHGDIVIENLPALMERLTDATGPILNVDDVKLLSPVANPSKIMGVPANFRESDGILPNVTPLDLGLFLKASSSICGPSEGVLCIWPDRLVEHEIELAVVIGRKGFGIPEEDALDFVAGYAIGLDMTAQGSEDRSFRKSFDTFSVVGPWLVTPDELGDPNDLQLKLFVDGDLRQAEGTCAFVMNVQQLIAYASSVYTLYPGDIIMTGSPGGVSAIRPGITMTASISGIGAMRVGVLPHRNH